MADVFRRFITNVTTTDLTTVFTVPVANVAASPPIPVSTFIVKTINTHGSADFQIFQIDVSASDTNTINTSMVYQEGDSMKVQANAASRAMIEVSILEVKQQL